MTWFVENVLMLVATLATWAAIGLGILWLPLRLAAAGPYVAVLSYAKFFGLVALVAWALVLVWVIVSPGGWH